ncbi:hypothetical protein KNE206_44110 [Kitasatospora sp. NE20-6]
MGVAVLRVDQVVQWSRLPTLWLQVPSAQVGRPSVSWKTKLPSDRDVGLSL